MAIEDILHVELEKAISAFMKVPRPDYVQKAMIRIAFDILRYYGYAIREDVKEANSPPTT